LASLDLYTIIVHVYLAWSKAVRSSVDCLIGACALRHSLTVAHRDRDFDALAKVSLLKIRRI